MPMASSQPCTLGSDDPHSVDWRLLGAAAAAVALLVGCTVEAVDEEPPPDTVANSADIIAVGDYETGDHSQWHLRRGNEDAAYRLGFVSSPKRQGAYAARFEVRDGDKAGTTSGERSELSNLIGALPYGAYSYKDFDPRASGNARYANRDEPGDDYYYAWSTRFPADFPNVKNWAVITQWHEATGGTGSVNLAVRIDANQRLVVTHNTCTEPRCFTGTVDEILPDIHTTNQKGIWHDLVVRVKWSCSNNGILELWHKRQNDTTYRKVVDRHGIQTAKSVNGTCQPIYKLQGLYRSSSNDATHVIFHDGYVQGTTFDAVTAHAHGFGGQEPRPQPDAELIPRDQWQVTASSEETAAEDGRAANAIDGDVNTLWVSQYTPSDLPQPHDLTLDLGAEYEIEALRYLASTGTTDFDQLGRIRDYEIHVSSDGLSWGSPVHTGVFRNTQDEQEVQLAVPATGRFVRLRALSEVHGNPWAIAAEVNLVGRVPEPSVTASSFQDPNRPENTLDADRTTRWSAHGQGQWIAYDLGLERTIDHVDITWHRGDRRRARFHVEVSDDGETWTRILSDHESSGTTAGPERYSLGDTEGRFLRVIGLGNTDNDWNSIAEVQIIL